MPFEKIDGHQAYLIETHSIPGFSGSPVMVLIPLNRYHPRYADDQTGLRVHYLLGISRSMSKTYDPIYKHGRGGYEETRDRFVRTNTGFTAVIPAKCLDSLLYQPKVIEMRKRDEEEWHRRQEKQEPTLEPTSTPILRQRTKPKKGNPIEIPIPTRREVLDVFKKATRKRRPS
jgi:hypothetical protein